MAGFGEPKRCKKKKSAIQQDLDSNSKEIIEEALIAYQSGNIFKAKLIAEKAIKEHANESFSLGLLATIENAIGNKVKAARLFEQSISFDSNNPDILHNYSGLLKEIDANSAGAVKQVNNYKSFK